MFEKLIIFSNTFPNLVLAISVTLLCVLVLEYIKGGKVISVHALVRLINDSKVFVVDIRPEKDYKLGRIKNAVNIPNGKFQNALPLLNKHKNNQIVLVCATGFSSRSAAEKLAILGFQVSRLAGGIASWSESNIPLVKK